MLLRLLSHLRSRFFQLNLLIILPVSLIAGHLVVTHGREYKFWELVWRTYYQLSVLYSSIIALVLLLLIYGISLKLYGRFGGNGLTRYWLLGQVCYGIMGVVLIELMCAMLLFWWQGHWIGDTAYFEKLFDPIVLFIAFCNACYLLYFSNRRNSVTVRYRLLDNTVRQAPVEVGVKTIPAILSMEEGTIWYVDFSGRRAEWHLPTLKASWQELGLADYFRGDRDWIVHRALIIDMEPLPGKRLLVTCFLQREFTLVVSRRNVPNFKRWKVGDLEGIKI